MLNSKLLPIAGKKRLPPWVRTSDFQPREFSAGSTYQPGKPRLLDDRQILPLVEGAVETW
jgi:hypothetical protein